MRRKLRFLSTIHWNRSREAVYLLLFVALALYIGTIPAASSLKTRYERLISDRWSDRSGETLRIKQNEKGYFALLQQEPIPEFEKALLAKEDHLFYYHFGVNPVSIVRDLLSTVTGRRREGSSTLTQQLAKNLLGNESERTLRNKLTETLYAIALEIHSSKREILSMYENTAYFGKQIEGVAAASEFYFGKPANELSGEEIVRLVATLGSPSQRYPGTEANSTYSAKFAAALGLALEDEENAQAISPNTSLRAKRNFFELEEFSKTCADDCRFTVDADLTGSIRTILARHLDRTLATAQNGAVVVLKLPQNEVQAIVGSPHPNSSLSGHQLNMATAPRPIGSTAKPFIYLSAFEQGLRPYTLVDDEEYAYSIGTGFAFYPKNYDGKFRGEVTLHQALSNSLNVPAVKVLEFGGLPHFYELLQKRLGFIPYQPLDRYELGIALGALEMDLVTLSHYFTIFPNDGVLRPLTLISDEPGKLRAPMGSLSPENRVADPALVRLITRVLSDREAGVEQFGTVSSLTLPAKNYAVKTGTSRDYHDSWTIGYTPDFLVGVWIGNSDNTPMRELSGQSGAGSIWHDVMTLLLETEYNKGTPFNFAGVREFSEGGSLEYGLAGDDYAKARMLLKEEHLILGPHDHDQIELSKTTVIPLRASGDVEWFIDTVRLGGGALLSWHPTQSGDVRIEAKSSDLKESITVHLISPTN